jgi:hypothetical protein
LKSTLPFGFGTVPLNPTVSRIVLVAPVVTQTDAGTSLFRAPAYRHVQRHHDPQVLERLLAAAGLRVKAVYGQTDAGPPEAVLEPDRHTKALYVVAKAWTGRRQRPKKRKTPAGGRGSSI